jgi:hypothetical protein
MKSGVMASEGNISEKMKPRLAQSSPSCCHLTHVHPLIN